MGNSVILAATSATTTQATRSPMAGSAIGPALPIVPGRHRRRQLPDQAAQPEAAERPGQPNGQDR